MSFASCKQQQQQQQQQQNLQNIIFRLMVETVERFSMLIGYPLFAMIQFLNV